MKDRHKILRIAIFFAIGLLGLAFFRLGFMVFHTSEERGPASVTRAYDYSHLDGSNLKKAAQDRIIDGAKVVTAGNSRGIELGHFLVRGANGVVDACSLYQKVTLKFVAGDMAVSGEPPLLTVEGPCQTDDRGLTILPLMFDYEPISRGLVTDKTFTEGLDRNVKLSFENVSDSWPRVWVLNSVRLEGHKVDPLDVTREDIRRVLGRAPSLEW